MEKIKKHKIYIAKMLLEINDKDIYNTKYCKENKLFISMKTGELQHRNVYLLISQGLLKVKREINGISKKLCKLYITGKDLKSALKNYYQI